MEMFGTTEGMVVLNAIKLMIIQYYVKLSQFKNIKEQHHGWHCGLEGEAATCNAAIPYGFMIVSWSLHL